MTDRILLAALTFLGVALLMCLGGIIYLTATGDRPIPDVLVGTTGVIAGTFGGILIPNTRRPV